MKAIVNGTIICPNNGLIRKGIVLFDQGLIKGIGKDISIGDAEIIDADGKYVVPGFIDAHTHQGLFDGTIGWAGEDGNEMTDPITPHVRGIDSFNPLEPSLKDVIKGGVTTINTGPGSGNVISGECLAIKPLGSNIVEDLIIKAPSGLKIALGENPKRVHGQTNKRMPSTRMGVAALLRKTFTDAQNYIDEHKAYQQKLAYTEVNGKAPPTPPKRDLKMETITKVINREIPLHAHAHRSDDIATIIRIAEEFNLKLILIHCTEGHKIADYIAKKDIPAVIGPTMTWVSKPETKEKGFKSAVILAKAGVKIALQTDSLTPMNYFPLLPISMIKEGLAEEEALRCVTLNPAEILELDNRIGSLDPGKDADIVIWSGHPFDYYSKVEKAFINGNEIYSENT